MMFKEIINSFLGSIFSVKLIRIGKNKIKHASVNTFTARKLIYLNDLIVRTSNIEGDIVECGVGWGYSLFCIGNSLQMVDSQKKIWGYDSFEGLPAPAVQDDPKRKNVKIVKGDLSYSEDYVLNRLVSSGLSPDYVASNIRLIKGYFQDSFKKVTPEKISFLHVDVDLFESYLQVLNELYPKVQKGGIIAFDEYNNSKWVGATKAIDSFFMNKSEKPIKANGIDRYYIVKQ